jgi:DNA-binding HxlR family transcriptional regulator
MNTMSRVNRSHCPIAFALDVFGDKWSLLILRDLIFKDKARFEDFLNSDEGISTNILADRLQKLKLAGLIKSKSDEMNGRKVIYRPTSKALDLVPMILEMIAWSAKYDSQTGAPKEFLEMLKNDRKRLIRQVRAKFNI